MCFLLKIISVTQKGFVVPIFLCHEKGTINVKLQTRIEPFKRYVMTKKKMNINNDIFLIGLLSIYPRIVRGRKLLRNPTFCVTFNTF